MVFPFQCDQLEIKSANNLIQIAVSLENVCRTTLGNNQYCVPENGFCSQDCFRLYQSRRSIYLHSSLNFGGWLANIFGRITLFSFFFLFCEGSPIIIKLAPFGLPRFNSLDGSLIFLSNSIFAEKKDMRDSQKYFILNPQLREGMTVKCFSSLAPDRKSFSWANQIAYSRTISIAQTQIHQILHF